MIPAAFRRRMAMPALLALAAAMMCDWIGAQPQGVDPTTPPRDVAPVTPPRDTGSTTPSRYGLSADASKIFEQWLHSSCIGDEERALSETLARYRGALAPAFKKAIADGPPEEELRSVRAAAEARYADRAKFPLDDYRIEGISREELARFRRVTQSEYADDQVRRYALGYRSNAVAALGIVDGPGAREVLERIASDKSNPLATTALEAIRRLRR